MQTVLKATLIVAAVGAALLTIDTSQADTTANRITEQRSIEAFSAIELHGPYDVVIDAQGRSGLKLTGERQQLDEVETFVRGDTLVVRPANTRIFQFGFGKRRQTVSIDIGAPQLASLKMSGSGDVALGQVNGERIALDVDGPGDLQASGAVRALALRVGGSGDADLQRIRAGQVDLTMNGPGDVRLANIDQSLQARLTGSGDLEADGLRLARLDARLTGPGGMCLRGSSLEVRAEITGSGDFDGADLKAVKAALKSRGPGSIELAHVSDTLEAELRGSGSLKATIEGKRFALTSDGPGGARIDGRVDQVHARLSGSGALDADGLHAARTDIVVTGPGRATVHVADGVRSTDGQLLVVQRRSAGQAPQ